MHASASSQTWSGRTQVPKLNSLFSKAKSNQQLDKERVNVGQGFTGELLHWDVTFWAERLREAKFNITDEQLRPYFSLPNVLDGLFKVRASKNESTGQLTGKYRTGML